MVASVNKTTVRDAVYGILGLAVGVMFGVCEPRKIHSVVIDYGFRIVSCVLVLLYIVVTVRSMRRDEAHFAKMEAGLARDRRALLDAQRALHTTQKETN